MSKITTSIDFYSRFATDYDSMTYDRTRWKKVAQQYTRIFAGKSIRRILDAGCGTGGECMVLAQAGYEVTGVDATIGLIKIAMNKAAEQELPVKFQVDDIRSLKTIPDSSVDAVICRGNTLPHLLTTEDLKAALRSFARVTDSDGLLLIQWLNYERILRNRLRMVGATGEDPLFIRFYDFIDSKQLDFNLITLRKGQSWKTDWITTKLRPWVADDIKACLEKTEWRNPSLYGDIELNEFEPDGSGNVVLLAEKG